MLAPIALPPGVCPIAYAIIAGHLKGGQVSGLGYLKSNRFKYTYFTVANGIGGIVDLISILSL